MTEAENAFVSSLYHNDLNEVYHVLKAHHLNPIGIVDTKGYSALHIAALNDQLNTLDFFVNYLRKDLGDNYEKQMRIWVNTKTQDGFTALHLAAFRGNFTICKRLLELGADMFAKNKQGLGVMHIAAQGDQPLILTYFYKLGLRDDTTDEKGGSPLHWATYLGCEQATALLLSWGAQVNLQDADLQTPLHLGTLAGNTRIVRNLLLKGADRSIIDKDKHTAMDLAREAGADSITEMLKEPGPFADCSIKPPLRPYNHSRKSMMIYIFGFTSALALNVLFSVQYNELAVGFLYLVFTLASMTCFLVVSNLDPGYILPPARTDILELYESYDSLLVCPDCKIVRPPRSRHCQCCDRCVRKFDHHCPWINNCVAAQNLGWFYCFLSSTWFSLILNIILMIFVIVEPSEKEGLAGVTKTQSIIVSTIVASFSTVFLIPLT
mmetsp:Transcript_3313/g.6849  ORF Transcript_3313/g.6849 Transcript_3313/m.6849 type:complete len:436 (+) Transcript_3313:3102-4409(+)